MDKADFLTKMKKEKIFAVIRGDSTEQVLKTVAAVHKGGINFIEVTFTIPRAQEIITELVNLYKDDESIVIGAGTCLDVTTARTAILAGAKFVVSPHFDKEIMKVCNAYHIPVFPGATTVKDMLDCLRYGADVIKLFPGDIFGPNAIKAFKGPLPQAEFMPTGGVGLDNITEWLDKGAYAIGAGSILTKGSKTGDYDKVEEEAKKFHSIIENYG